MVPTRDDEIKVEEREKMEGVGGETDEERNERWKILYEFKAAFSPIMPPRENYDGICPFTKGASCPPGHTLTLCPDKSEAYYCKQCSDITFQPDENWLGDKCRFRVSCRKDHMFYVDHGSTTRDAVCGCFEGYYLPSNMDVRACFSNPICGPGKAPGKYGSCESCLEKGMYSDTKGPAKKKCKALTNCAKQGRCLEIESDGTMDNVCGPKISDSPCRKIEAPSIPSYWPRYVIAAGIPGTIILVFFIFALIYLHRRKQYRNSQRGVISQKNVFTQDQMEELKQRILKESERDPAICTKAISVTFSFIEERISHQIWTLAQELFRSHPVVGKYELIVENYKDCQGKYTVNGYLQEWRSWRGDTREGIVELFHCLRQVNREDIVYEVCAYLRNDIETSSGQESHLSPNAKYSGQDECTYIFFPCCYKPPKNTENPLPPSASSGQVVVEGEGEGEEAGTKLLAYPTDDLDDGSGEGGDECGEIVKQHPPPGKIYRDHPTPSAPPDLEDAGDFAGKDCCGAAELDSVKYSRQFSQPVQATS